MFQIVYLFIIYLNNFFDHLWKQVHYVKPPWELIFHFKWLQSFMFKEYFDFAVIEKFI